MEFSDWRFEKSGFTINVLHGGQVNWSHENADND